MDIRNMPAEAKNYEFVVAIPNVDHYIFLGMYTDGHVAEETALEYGGIVIHNMRIHGHQPKQPKPKKMYYTFSGEWSWGCWATNEEEARRMFDDADISIIDIDCDNIEVRANYDLP